MVQADAFKEVSILPLGGAKYIKRDFLCNIIEIRAL